MNVRDTGNVEVVEEKVPQVATTIEVEDPEESVQYEAVSAIATLG